MGKIKKTIISNKKIYQIIIAAFMAICVIITFSCFIYYNKLQKTLQSESGGYLQEISKQMGRNIDKTVHENFSALTTISNFMVSSKINSYEQVQTIAHEQQSTWNYQKLLLLDSSGSAHDSFGKVIPIDADEYIHDVVVANVKSISPAQVVSGKKCVIFAIPMESITIENTEMVALAACYDAKTFDELLTIDAFNDAGFAHIAKNDGTFVAKSPSKNAPESGYNIFNSFAKAKIDDNKTLDSIKAEIAADKDSQAGFTINNVGYYMSYTAIESQGWTLFTFVPADVINAKAHIFFKITFLFCAFVTLLFAVAYVSSILFFRSQRKKLEKLAFIDPVTCGNTIGRFCELADSKLKAEDNHNYALIFTNIVKFKLLNDQFGHEICDTILKEANAAIAADLSEIECMGRLFADNFCVLVSYSDVESTAARFDRWYGHAMQAIEQKISLQVQFSMEFGMLIIENDSTPFQHMIEMAKLSLHERTTQKRGKISFAVYDEQVRQQIIREKKLENMMESALQNNEFQVYLQPKYMTQIERISGAEALVRWLSPSEGMIYPDEFIPLFEKNGFIIQLDLWVFEEVCKTIQDWLKKGYSPLAISVNCSRMHLKSPGFLALYRAVADQYEIPTHLLEIELTENVVFEDVAKLTSTIEDIHAGGFSCSMDNFGKGFSSLNFLQDIPVDVLKLDKMFLTNSSKDMKRTESVIGGVISMAKALSMLTVAEGVEKRCQVEMLKRLGCDYIQGYFFAKPMPIDEFERLAFVQPKHIIAEKNKKFTI